MLGFTRGDCYEYKDGLPVLNFEELVSYIMEESQYPKTDKELLTREFNPRLRISRFTDYLCGNLRQCSRTCSHLLKRNLSYALTCTGVSIE